MKIGVVIVVLLVVGCVAERSTVSKRTKAPQDWKLMRPAALETEMNFFIALPQRNLDVLEQLYWDRSNPDSDNYLQWMSIDEINALVSPSADVAGVVYNWLIESGITKIKSFGDALEVTASVKSLQELFQTQFYEFENTKGDRIVRQWGELSVPNNIREHIYMVTGLSSFPFPKKPVPRIKKNGIWDDYIYVVPATIYGMYEIPQNFVPFANASQGVIEWEAQYFSPDDLTNFAQQMAAVNVDNPTPDRIVGTNVPSNPQEESTLDIQWISVTGVGIKNWFWIEGGTSWLYGFSVHFMNTQAVPQVISMSYGWNEEDQCEDGIGGDECNQLGVNSTTYVQRVNVEFQKMGLRGITLLAASGDSGANGRTDEDCSETHFNPAYPAASPFVTAVGATTLVDAVTNLQNLPPVCQGAILWWCASNGTEQAVSYSVSGFTSGGGFSNVAPMPDYQKSAVQAYLNTDAGKKAPASYFNANNRAYPDIAAVGDRILMWYAGADTSVGGTSASSPIFAGVFSLLNSYTLQKTGKTLGPVNQLIYKMAVEAPAAFTDVTVGDNSCTEDGCGSGCQGYYCAQGWDAVTGWGTPQYNEMLAYVQKLLSKKF
jgi:tripeptidyl-peptidase-1